MVVFPFLGTIYLTRCLTIHLGKGGTKLAGTDSDATKTLRINKVIDLLNKRSPTGVSPARSWQLPAV